MSGHCLDVVSLGKAFYTHMLHLIKVLMITCYNRAGNVYDKFNAQTWLQDCTLPVTFDFSIINYLGLTVYPPNYAI